MRGSFLQDVDEAYSTLLEEAYSTDLSDIDDAVMTRSLVTTHPTDRFCTGHLQHDHESNIWHACDSRRFACDAGRQVHLKNWCTGDYCVCPSQQRGHVA